jgi:hypothetical protein
MKFTFDQITEAIKPVLDLFEHVTEWETGVHYISGGFAVADYDWTDGIEKDVLEADTDIEDDPHVHFTLKWGVQSDVENRVHTEHYKISVANLLALGSTPKEKISNIEDDR